MHHRQICLDHGRTKIQQSLKQRHSPQQEMWAGCPVPPLCSLAQHWDSGWSPPSHGDFERNGGRSIELKKSNRHHAFYLHMIGKGPEHVGNNFIFSLFNRD